MSINNKRSYTEYTVTQPTVDFAIGFDDFDEGGKDNILVTLNGVLVESLGYAAIRKNENTVSITPAITEGTVRLTRETDIDEPFHKFTAGALFSAKSMDENFQQVRHSQQEVRDGFVFLEYNTNGIVQESKVATAQAKEATIEATASAVRAETAADTAVQAVGSLQGVVNAATTATTNANAATATATTAASQATAATTSAQNAAQAANTAKQEAAAAAANANAATVDTLAATGRANEAADVVADLVVGKVRAQDVSTADGSTQDVKNTEYRNELDALPFEGGVLADTFVTVTSNKGSIARNLRSYNADNIHLRSYGAIGDGQSHPLSSVYSSIADAQLVYPFAESLTQEIDVMAFQLAVNNNPRNSTINADGLDLYFGTLEFAKPAVHIKNPVNMSIIGQHTVTSTSEQYSVAIAIENPISFSAVGAFFNDPLFDINKEGMTGKEGVYAYEVFATAPYNSENRCGNVSIDANAESMLGLVGSNGLNQKGLLVTPNPLAVEDVRVRGNIKNVYYGVSTVYGCEHIKVRLNCHNVKRAFINYGSSHCDIYAALKCDAGFIGSNAFIGIIEEGDANPPLEDIKVAISVSGVEAHARYISMYHQGAAKYGSISNVNAKATFNNLTTVGKNPQLPVANAFAHVWDSNVGAEQATTDRFIDNISIDINIKGSISGKVIETVSAPNDKNGRLYLSGSTSASLAQTVASLSIWNNYKVLRGSLSIPNLTGGVVGTTTRGTATYSKNTCSLNIIDGRAFFDIAIVWTGHTGVGNIYYESLPIWQRVARLGAFNGVYTGSDVNVFFGLAGTFADTIYVYTKKPSEGVGFAPIVPNAELHTNFSISLY